MQRAPSAPPVIEGYTVERAIGTGGFSDVFLYEQALPKRRVAVKVMLAQELTASARAAFVSEANLMAALSTHPYIVTIYHAGVAADGRPYLVMEYCSRPSLAERYKRQPLSVADALRTGIRVAGAVATAHAAGILHRDIKPGNVLTNDYGWPALTDFGIASVFGDGTPEDAAPAARDDPEGTGGTIGLSVPWSPPEMFVDVPTPDVRSDIFSLAATIHTVLAGRTPFEVPGGPNGTLDLIARIERGEVTPLTRTDVPVSLVAALAKAMAPRREDRYPSAVEFARALQRIELELGYAPTGIEVPVIDVEPGGVAAAGEAAGEDETRMRSIPTVDPQPGAPAVSASEQTVLASPPRGVTPVDAVGGPHRRRWIGILVGAVAALAVAAIVAAVLVGGGSLRGGGATPTATSSGGSAVSSGVRPPTDGGALVSQDGSSVVFTWTDPAPKPGDVFYWARSETPDDRTATPQPTATVSGIVPGSRVCIDVEIGRSGSTSEPLRICSTP